MATIQRIFLGPGIRDLPKRASRRARKRLQRKLFERFEAGESVQVETKVVKIAGRKAYRHRR